MTLGPLTQSGVNLDVSKIWKELGNRERVEWLFTRPPLLRPCRSAAGLSRIWDSDKEKPREEGRTHMSIIKGLHFN